ncbi:carboxypeptidase regulatory-like domain-containing protein, partial [Bacteroides xylanisolvens]
MKSVKWFYVGAMAIALGILTFATVACHDDDDDPKPAEGEVIETPKPVVEYYIMGTVTSGGEAMNGVKVKVGSKNYTTDSNGKFSVTESATGTYSIEASSNGYLSQKTSVVIAENAENRSVVTVALALTKESRKETVSVTAEEEIKVEDNSESNTTIEDPGEVAPEAVVEDKPLVKVELAIPAGAIDTEASASLISDGNVGISVTTFVPAPAEVTTEVKAEEVNQNVEKSIPLAAAKFEPSGLKFKNDVTISIPNPIPGITFADADMILTYQNPDTGEWGDAKDNDGNVIKNVSSTTENGAVTAYTADVDHFSAYAIENKVYSKISNETVTTNILGQASRDNSENAKAVTGIELKYKEKSGWDYDKNDAGLVAEVKSQLGAGASAEDTKTVNAMVAFMKTRMFSLMGSVSGITETERVYNTVNVNGYTTMSYTCYAKARTTTLTANVKFNGQNKTVSITATRYTGTDHQYKT